MAKFKVDYDQYSIAVSDPDPNDQWDKADVERTTSINGIIPVQEGYYDVIALDDNAEQYYLLYVVYETGDSFHRDSGVVEFVDLHSDYDIAIANANKIRQHYEQDDDKFSVTLTDDAGATFTQHCPWTGFFERVQDIIVEPVRVINKGKYHA